MTPRLLSIQGLVLGVFWLLALGYLSVPAVDPDYGWHVANGRHLLDGVLFAGVDVYSWTARGATWIAHEWLTEGVMAGLHDTLGPTATSVLAGLLGSTAALLTILRLRRRGFGLAAVLVVGVIALLDAGTLVSVGPAAVEVFCLALLLWLIETWRAGALGGRVAAAAVLLLILVWANAHGSFVLGIGVLGASWLSLTWERDPRARVAFGLLIAGAVITLVNPFGFRLWGYVATAITGARLQLISEWTPPHLTDRMWWPFVAALVLAGVGVGGWIVGRARRGGREPRVRRAPGPGLEPRPAPDPRNPRLDDVLIGAALAIAGLAHARHAGIFGIGAAPLIAAGLAALVGILPPIRRGPLRPRRPMRAIPRLNLAVLGLVAVTTVALIAVRVGPSNQAAATRAEYPVGALPALDALVCDEGGSPNLFNDYSWGGWLEMVRPNIPVFIDGRSEVYGDAQVIKYATILVAIGGWAVALDAAGVDSALVHTRSPLATALQARGWTVVYGDEVATLLRRGGGLTGCRTSVLFP